MNKKYISIALIVIVIIIGIAYLLTQKQTVKNSIKKDVGSDSRINTTAILEKNMSASVVYGQQGFTPEKIKIKSGSIVNIANQTNEEKKITVSGKTNVDLIIKGGQSAYTPVLVEKGTYYVGVGKSGRVEIIVE